MTTEERANHLAGRKRLTPAEEIRSSLVEATPSPATATVSTGPTEAADGVVRVRPSARVADDLTAEGRPVRTRGARANLSAKIAVSTRSRLDAYLEKTGRYATDVVDAAIAGYLSERGY